MFLFRILFHMKLAQEIGGKGLKEEIKILPPSVKIYKKEADAFPDAVFIICLSGSCKHLALTIVTVYNSSLSSYIFGLVIVTVTRRNETVPTSDS